jgi:hypothetical protein
MAEQAQKAAQGDVATPIIINLGKQRRKRIKDLKRSRGVLFEEVLETIAQVNGELGPEAAGKVLVPVVLIYRERPKRSSPFRF